MMLETGDILEPIEAGTPLPAGQYQVVSGDTETIWLNRLPAGPDDKTPATSRMRSIPRSAAVQFRKVRGDEEIYVDGD